MKKVIRSTTVIAVCLVLVAICLLTGCQSNIQANARRHINSINHRGYVDAPENTLSAFRMSKEMGFDCVECDVRFTKDNQPVLLHDKTVIRTSNGRGKISDMTLDEVRRLDFGSWKSMQYVGEQIPTFEEFISLCAELELHPYVEIKNDVTLQQTQRLVEIVDKTDLSVTWIGRDRDVLTLISQLRIGDRIGLLTELLNQDALRYLSQLSETTEVFADCFYATLTRSQIKRAKLFGIPIEVWTVNSEAIVSNIDPYITGVTSDFINAQELFNTL
ncbi:MAG: hypothetical protein J1G02_03760 [Clostridiales bacterium]|nr:hypothetical protein [Clostridiales bacterium]